MKDDARRTRIELPLLQLVPNLVTLAAVVAGITSIRFSLQGDYEMAAVLIIVAGILDALDGRLARLLGSESAFGAELDSLGDFVSFGVAPAILIHAWALQDARSAGWIAALVYALCCMMRLARFNLGARGDPPDTDKRFFTGVPSPAGALLVMLPLFVSLLLDGAPPPPWPLVAGYAVLVGLLMISRVPTWSLKAITIYADHARYVMVGFAALSAALLTYPWATLIAFDVIYLGAVLVLAARRKTIF
jgi:CDP-diacylglycerol--serine O-phosphatidyltransferase